MESTTEHIEDQSGVAATEKKPNNYFSFKALKDFFTAKWLFTNLNYFLFLCGLMVLYIANGHYYDRTIRQINKTQNEIKNLQYEYKTIKGELMFKSEEEQVLKVATPLGLKVSKEVPLHLQEEKK